MKTAHYCIAGHPITIHFQQEADEQLLRSFQPFRIEDNTNDSIMELTVGDTTSKASDDHKIGQFDCGGCDTAVYRLTDNGYRLEFFNFTKELCGILTTDQAFHHCAVTLLCQQPSERHYALNNALMICYAFATADCDTMLIHASVIRHEGRGYLMTAPSGTGKSTHTRLWYDNIPGCDLMNDDNPVIRIIDGEAIVYGSPWSGKTPCYRNIQAPIGGIVRLWQEPQNSIRRLSVLEAYSHLLPAISNMKWDERIHRGICHGVEELIRICGMYGLGCLPNAEAALLCKDTLEGQIPSSQETSR